MFAQLKRLAVKAGLLTGVISLLTFAGALAASGDLDTTFSGDGLATNFMIPSDPGRIDIIEGIAIQPNGRIVAAGYSLVDTLEPTDPANSEFSIARYNNTNGSLDSTFSGDGRLVTNFGGQDKAQDVAVQPDGKILAAGSACNLFGSSCNVALARYTPGGTLDSSFSGDGKQTTDFGGSENTSEAILIQSDGKIVLAGQMWNGNNWDFAVYRYNANGSLDPTFSGDGMVSFGFGPGHQDLAQDVAFQRSDGKIVIAGYTANASFSGNDFALARLNPNGTLDKTFSGDGKQITDFNGEDFAWGFAGQADGRMIVVGQTDRGGKSQFAMARYRADGSLDPSFNVTGKKIFRIIPGFDAWAAEAFVQPDGKIVVVGTTMNNGGSNFALVRLKAGGGFDTSFSGDGRLTIEFGGSGEGYALARQPSDGKYVLGGTAIDAGWSDFAVARVLP